MRDTVYVEELVAPRTVNTMPEKTLEAVWDHGTIRSNTIEATYDESRRIVDALEAMGISLEDVAATLEAEGIATFSSVVGATHRRRRGTAPDPGEHERTLIERGCRARAGV